MSHEIVVQPLPEMDSITFRLHTSAKIRLRQMALEEGLSLEEKMRSLLYPTLGLGLPVLLITPRRRKRRLHLLESAS